VKLDDLFCEAGRLPPDLRNDIKAVVTLYRRSRDTRNPNSKP
jgi:HTH-type transcriptional regulator, competence development regulator